MNVMEFEPLLADEGGFLDEMFSDLPEDLWSTARAFGLNEDECLRAFLATVGGGSPATGAAETAFVIHASANGNPYMDHLATLLLSFAPGGLNPTGPTAVGNPA